MECSHKQTVIFGTESVPIEDLKMESDPRKINNIFNIKQI